MAENIAPRSAEFRPKPPRASAAPVCGEGCRVPAATSAKAKAPRSSAMREWKATWNSRSPSSSFSSSIASRSIASATS